MYEPPIIIAEIGCNHKGDMEIAREMIEVAAHFCKVDAVKFQKRSNRELLSKAQYDAPHPMPYHAYGETYGAHREALEFDLDQHRQLKSWSEAAGLVYAASVWDLTSAKEIASLSPEFIKIPSACNTNFEMLRWLCESYRGEIQISFGMTNRREEEEIVSLFERLDRAKDLLIMSCTSGYPVPFEDICLLEIPRLKEQFGARVKSIGFSGHHLGIAPDVAAVVLGAKVVERHFTLDRTWRGTDHAASLEPGGMRKLKRDLDHVVQALTLKESEILPIEDFQRRKLKWKGNE